MTREDQIKKAAEIIAYGCSDELKAALIQDFPELAESEDERICEALINYFKSHSSLVGENWNGIECDDIIAYLEKQKEPQEIPLMNGDADLYFDNWRQKVSVPTFRQCFEEGIRYAQRLQKEQKLAECIPDSIKFDEGFKTGREVGFREGVESVKPAEWSDEDENIRQALILLVSNDKKNGYTEFYKAQEITCDKVIAFLRKLKQFPTNEEMLRTLRVEYEKGVADTIAKYEQKEQKPNIELIQRSWYMEGYHDREFGKEPKWILKTGEGGPKHIENERYGQPLKQEQTSNIPWVKSDNVTNPDKPYIDKAGWFYTTDGRMCLASEIEKQKEQKSIFPEGLGEVRWNPISVQKEQKPDSLIYDKDLDKAAREFYLSGGADSPVDSTGLVPIVRMAEFGATWMKERIEKEQKTINQCNTHEPSLDEARKWNEAYEKGYSLGYQNGRNEQNPAEIDESAHELLDRIKEFFGEQKPWEWSEEERKILDSIIDDYEKASKSFCGYDGKIGLLRAIRDGEYNLPKPAWSEEDEECRKEIIEYIEQRLGDGTSGQAVWKKWHSWLKALPERFNLQQKQEWSKEDERIRKSLIELVEQFMTDERKEKTLAYLEKQKDANKAIECLEHFLYRGLEIEKTTAWSEGDEEKLKAICTYLRDYSRLAKLGDKLRFNEYCDFLESLRPQKLNASKLENFDPVDVLNRIKTEWPMAWEKVVGEQEWNEEDETRLTNILIMLKEYVIHHYSKDDVNKSIDWLENRVKSLRS